MTTVETQEPKPWIPHNMTPGQIWRFGFANGISFSRFATPVFIILWYYPAVRAGNVAGSAWWLLIIALHTATDFIDGMIARGGNEVTSKLGSVLDHVTDKMILGTALVIWALLLAPVAPRPLFVITLIVIILMVVLELAVFYYNLNPKLWSKGATDFGRVKYVIQGCSLAVAYIGLTWYYASTNAVVGLTIIADCGLVIAMTLALLSIEQYRERAVALK